MTHPLLAFGGVSARAVGDVLANGRQFGLVIAPNAAVQIRFNTVPGHRADILVDNLGDMAACGLPCGDWVVRCGKDQPIAGMAHVGRATEFLMARVRRALAREMDALAHERKYRGASGGVASAFDAAKAMRLAKGSRQKTALNCG